MTINPQDYNREERKSSSWWSSRHPETRDSSVILKRTRRLTLIDLVLLVVMMGILIPLILRQSDNLVLGPYQIRIREKKRDQERLIVLRIHLPGKSVHTEESPVGWILYNHMGDSLHEDWDLPPGPGETREFFFISETDGLIRCEVIVGDDILTRLLGDEP